MHINAAGTAIIKDFERCRLVPYHDQRGFPTIAYGHLLSTIRNDDLSRWKPITQAQADALLVQDLAIAERIANQTLSMPVSANEFSACVSLIFNIGEANWRSPKCMVRPYLAMGNRQAAADEFLNWNKVTINGVKTVSTGLSRRRNAERVLFLTPDVLVNDPYGEC